MKSRFFILLVGFFALSAGTVGSARSQFQNAIGSESKLKKLIKDYKSSEIAICNAYVGLAEGMMAEHVSMPNTKLSYFNRGKKRIENAVTAKPKDTEIRYIRLMVQLNAPEFLGYSAQRQSDLNFFIKTLPGRNYSLYWKNKFVDNLLLTKYLSSKQREQLQTLKQKLK